MIDKSFVEKILELAPTQELEIKGRKYTNKQIMKVTEPEAYALKFGTLTGIKDYIELNLDNTSLESVMLHVEDFQTVSIIGGLFGEFRQREKLVIASSHDCGFKFGSWYERESFQIGLMASFAPTAMRDNVLKFVTGIVQSAELKTSDDGISQRVTAKTGIARIAEVDVPNPVTLKPYRTFAEADQPESDFVFRVRNTNNNEIGVALFEADGGRWKLQAAINIKEWLTENIPGVRVII